MFDNDPFDAEIGTPDLFDEFRVVDTFDPEAAGAGHAGGNLAEVDRSAGGDAGRSRLTRRDDESTRHSLAVDRSADRTVAIGNRVVLAVAVAQDEARWHKRDEGTDDPSRAVFEHRAAASSDDRIVGFARPRRVEIDRALVHMMTVASRSTSE